MIHVKIIKKGMMMFQLTDVKGTVELWMQK